LRVEQSASHVEDTRVAALREQLNALARSIGSMSATVESPENSGDTREAVAQLEDAISRLADLQATVTASLAVREKPPLSEDPTINPDFDTSEQNPAFTDSSLPPSDGTYRDARLQELLDQLAAAANRLEQGANRLERLNRTKR
jgi:uncharacterized coiled-coil protein SlyX